ncbi:FG-GAP repeat domain-containing protein [Methylococcus geothermalis]|uniref:VCBS repeat-containing protein n=1 Tax=Methylococcus geothermalis TaxID=2681310 RepID=A0A858QBP1_9GAMM|nr:VCBS repeat-containing protein [Methylococcus geothermalis]QJD31201.1 VCBS repeat-containing protein [Methylococcus geothermalis]
MNYFYWIVLAALSSVALAACRSPSPSLHALSEDVASLQQSLPFDAPPFHVATDDVDGDGRLDVIAVAHGGNYAQAFFQKEPRVFSPGPTVPEVGFHPGDFVRLPSKERLYAAAAEGVNQLIVLEPTLAGGFRVRNRVPETAPRHLSVFRWPDWGTSLAVSSFHEDEVSLWKGFDPVTGKAVGRIAVPLREQPQKKSIRRADRIVPVDIDGDGIEELLFTIQQNHSLWMIRHPEKIDDTVTPIQVRDFVRGAPNQVAVADLDGNKAPDLLIPNQSQPFHIHVLINEGQGAFKDAAPLSFPTTMGIRQVAVGQDRDDATCLMAVGYGALAIYRFPPSWDGHAAVPMRSVPMARNEGSQILLLRDIDGDGWLDGVLGRGKGGNGVWIVYGPLWQHFEDLAAGQFVLR